MAAVSVRRSIVFWTFSFSPIQGWGALFLGPKTLDFSLVPKPGFNLHPVALYGEAPPERGTFFKLQVHQRVWISLNEVYESVGKSVIPACIQAKRPYICISWPGKYSLYSELKTKSDLNLTLI